MYHQVYHAVCHYLIDMVEPVIVSLELSLERLMFLEFGQQVGEVLEGFVCCSLVLLLDPVRQLQMDW